MQALYDRALSDLEAMRFEAACPRLEEVIRLAPDALGAKLMLAACYEGWGRLASAWSQYALVEAEANKVGDLNRELKAADKAAELKPKLATVAIDVPPDVRSTPGLTITRDGLPVREAQWSVPLPVDTGQHEIIVTGSGYKPWKRQIEVATDGSRVVVHIPPLEPVASAGPSGATIHGPERPWQRPAAVVAMGLGAAGLTAGAVLGGLAIARNNESNGGHCSAQDRCDPRGLELRREAVGLGNGSTVALVAGGLLAAGGVALFVTAPPPAQSGDRAGATRAGWRVEAALLPGGMALRGVW